MVSLTTVYVISVILTSIAGIGSSFASDKLVGGSQPNAQTVSEQPPPVQEEPPVSNIEQTSP